MKSHPNLNALLNHIEAHPEELLVWIENQVVFAELVKQAQKDGVLIQPKPPWWKQVAHFCRRFILPDLVSLHGNAYVDETLRKNATKKAVVIGVANTITIIPTLPLLAITFSGTGVLGIPLTATLATLTLKGMNAMAEWVIAEWTRETRQRWVNLVGTGLLQTSLTLVAGIGTTLLLDAPSLRQQWAVTQSEAVITARHQAGQEQTKLLEGTTTDYQALCDALMEKMEGFPEGSVERNDLFTQALGLYKDINLDRSQIPTKQLTGKCHVAEGYRRDVANLRQQLLKDKAIATEMLRSNGALTYLRQEAPDIYALHFSEDGHLLSGTRQTQLATEMFIDNLLAGQVGALLLALFVLTLSTVPSAVMVFKLATFRCRADVVRSFNPQIALLRDELFYRAQLGLLKALAALPETDSEAIDSQSLS